MRARHPCAILAASLFLSMIAGGAAKGAPQPVALTLTNIWGGNRIPLMETVLARFMAKYPWITVENEVGGGDILEKALVAIAAGSPPDVLMVDRLRIPEFVDAGLLQPLDPYIARSELDLDIFYPAERRSSQYRGSTWVLPMPTASLSLLYYNRTLFAEKGFDPDAPPKTWDEMLRFAQRLQEMNPDGTVRVSGGNIDYFPRYRLAQMAALNGARLFGSDGLSPDDVSSQVLTTANWVAGFGQRIARGGSLAHGTRAMETNGEWIYFQVKQDLPDLDLGIALVPHGPDGEYVNLVAAAWSYGMPVGVPHPDESWLLIEFLTTSEEGAAYFTLQQARPSPVRAFTLNPAYFEMNPYWGVVGEALARSWATPPSPVAQKFIDADIAWYGRILQGQEAPAAAVETLQSEMEAIVANYLGQ